MKTLRNLFLACAGLLVCACNSDNEPQFPEGEGMVEVKIVSPTTRADGDKINIKGDITITLTHANGTLQQKVTVGDGTAARTQTVKFWNVVNPSKVTASINGGVADYSSVNITTLQVEPNVTPAYGEVGTFGKDGTITATAEDNITTNGNNNGYKTGDTGKSFTKYTAAVTMAIPVARLEVGAITAPAAGNDKTFKTLTLTGVYLDDVYETGGVYSPSAFAAPTSTVVNYDGTGYENATLKKEGATASAFNFYGEGTMPVFKVYFEDAVFASGTEADEARSGWAMVTTYKDSEGTKLTKFENGKIYQIADVTLLDKNIVGDEENSALYAVEVTVTEAVWTVETTSAEWAQ